MPSSVIFLSQPFLFAAVADGCFTSAWNDRLNLSLKPLLSFPFPVNGCSGCFRRLVVAFMKCVFRRIRRRLHSSCAMVCTRVRRSITQQPRHQFGDRIAPSIKPRSVAAAHKITVWFSGLAAEFLPHKEAGLNKSVQVSAGGVAMTAQLLCYLLGRQEDITLPAPCRTDCGRGDHALDHPDDF